MKQAFSLFIVPLILLPALALTGCEKVSGGRSASKASGTEDATSGYTKEGGETVNGFVLPPYPDRALNDSTLLGIDSNNNGVRDDVERWLIFRYKDHHRIVTEIGFQTARAAQIVIQDPSKAKETYPILDAAQFCNSYFKIYAKYNNEQVLVDHAIAASTAFKTMQFNTKERIEAYLAYDKALSGGAYSIPKSSREYREKCAFDIDAMLKEQK